MLRKSRVNHVIDTLRASVSKVKSTNQHVYEIKHTVNGDRRLRDVRSDDTLALSRGSWVEDAALHFGGKLRVNGIHVELRHQLSEALQTLVKERAS